MRAPVQIETSDGLRCDYTVECPIDGPLPKAVEEKIGTIINEIVNFSDQDPSQWGARAMAEWLLGKVCDICGTALGADGWHPVDVVDRCVEDPWEPITRAAFLARKVER